MPAPFSVSFTNEKIWSDNAGRTADCTMVGETNESKGRILQLSCPYMNRSLLDSLFSRVKNYTWYTAQFRHRLGDPRLDVGDVVTYSGAAIPVTGLAFSYDGGLSADITAAGLNDEEQLI